MMAGDTIITTNACRFQHFLTILINTTKYYISLKNNTPSIGNMTQLQYPISLANEKVPESELPNGIFTLPVHNTSALPSGSVQEQCIPNIPSEKYESTVNYQIACLNSIVTQSQYI